MPFGDVSGMVSHRRQLLVTVPVFPMHPVRVFPLLRLLLPGFVVPLAASCFVALLSRALLFVAFCFPASV